MIRLAMSEPQLRDLLIRQLSSLYFLNEAEAETLEGVLPKALERCEVCFSHVRNKYYSDIGGCTNLDPLHGCQHAFLLYTLARCIYLQKGSLPLCDKLYGLLRMMASVDLFYQVELPVIFTFDHPLGTVMGRARYSDYFSFSQGCTVGNNHGEYPSFGESVFMLSNSKVLGGCKIGSHVIISANTYIKDTDIPSGSIVFGQSPNLVIKTGRGDYVREYAEGIFRYE